jgi:hypothetical protein
MAPIVIAGAAIGVTAVGHALLGFGLCTRDGRRPGLPYGLAPRLALSAHLRPPADTHSQVGECLCNERSKQEYGAKGHADGDDSHRDCAFI